jgi:hypothetical protein
VVVVPSSFPQLEVFELEGFEINPNNIKSKFNIVLKNLKIDIRVLPCDTGRKHVYTLLKKKRFLNFWEVTFKNGREISASQARDLPPSYQVVF